MSKTNNEVITDEIGTFLDMATDDLAKAMNYVRAAMRQATGCELMLTAQVNKAIIEAGNALDGLRYARGAK